jgi:hypothetical protein
VEIASSSAIGNLIYDNWLFDMTRFFDLASIYGASNNGLLLNLFSSVFALQPDYINDVRESVDAVSKILTTTLRDHHANASASAAKQFDGTEAHVLSLAHLVLDLSSALFYFLSCCPQAIQPFVDRCFFVQLAVFYNAIAPPLTAAACRPTDQPLLRRALFQLLTATDLILHASILAAHDAAAPMLLQALSELLDLPAFLADFCGCFPLVPRLHELAARVAMMDDTHLQHIRDAVRHLDGACLVARSSQPRPAAVSVPPRAAAASAGAAAAEDVRALFSLLLLFIPRLSSRDESLMAGPNGEHRDGQGAATRPRRWLRQPLPRGIWGLFHPCPTPCPPCPAHRPTLPKLLPVLTAGQRRDDYQPHPRGLAARALQGSPAQLGPPPVRACDPLLLPAPFPPFILLLLPHLCPHALTPAPLTPGRTLLPRQTMRPRAMRPWTSRLRSRIPSLPSQPSLPAFHSSPQDSSPLLTPGVHGPNARPGPAAQCCSRAARQEVLACP